MAVKYNICSACQWFQKRLILEDKTVPKHCKNPKLREYFGEIVGGFP